MNQIKMNKNSLNIISPGIWYTIHSISFTIKIYEEYIFFINYIKWVELYFPCEKCRTDIKLYLIENPLPSVEKKIINNKLKIGNSNFSWKDISLECFEWTYLFHNHVNKKLGKKEIEIIEAYDIVTEYINGCNSNFCIIEKDK